MGSMVKRRKRKGFGWTRKKKSKAKTHPQTALPELAVPEAEDHRTVQHDKRWEIFNPRTPGSFGGVDALHRHLKGTKSKKELREWLRGRPTYTQHFPIVRKFKTNRTVVYAIDEQWQSDLVDVSNLAPFNDGSNWLLTCIDILSKCAWVIPLLNKTGVSVKAGFETIFKQSNRVPEKLQTDQGKEFDNAVCQKYFKSLNINHFYALSSESKCAVIERFHRTLRNKMWRYLSHNETKRYINVLDDLVYSYNHTYHSSIKMTPVEVNEQNVKQVWRNLYSDIVKRQQSERSSTLSNKKRHKKEKRRYKLSVGDSVRISIYRTPFQKGYDQGWTEEIYTVSHRIPHFPATVYRLRDSEGEQIRGVFYEAELQKVAKPDLLAIEEILSEKGRGKNKQFLVKWRGYPSSANSWVSQNQIEDIDKAK